MIHDCIFHKLENSRKFSNSQPQSFEPYYRLTHTHGYVRMHADIGERDDISHRNGSSSDVTEKTKVRKVTYYRRLYFNSVLLIHPKY